MKIVVKHEMPLSEKKKNIYIYIYIYKRDDIQKCIKNKPGF